ncbi:MAG TPA: glycosyltransferase family 87 protein [Pyrinomonadaceae bacterium]|nr:glycosyltransferase family 87 protein [Pyrinomonadaceae bacterium]
MNEPRAGEPRAIGSTHHAASTHGEFSMRGEDSTHDEVSAHGAASTHGAMSSHRVLSRTNLLLVALGLASLALYRYGVKFDRARPLSEIVWFIKLALAQCALAACAAWLVWRGREVRSMLIILIVFAALFRLSVLFTPPQLSDDIYRYIWDGRVQAARVNPYRYIPADDALRFLRDPDIYPNINRRDFAPTIYPPLAQMIFFLATRVSEQVVWMKVVMVLFEGVGLYALSALLASFGWPRQRVLVAAAWHPLAVWEIAGSGHLDALVVAFVALALVARRRGREGLTGVLLASAVLVKLFPVVLFPALYRRWGWRMPLAFCATLVAGYLPYIRVGARRVLGYLPGYAGEEGLQSGERFFVLQLAGTLFGEQPVARAAYFVFAFLILGALGAWCLFRRELKAHDYARRAALLATAFTVLLSPHYSWYFVWLVPFLCLVPAKSFAPLVYLTAACFMLYGTWLGDAPAQMLRLNACIYLPPVLLLLPYFYRRRGARDVDALTATL